MNEKEITQPIYSPEIIKLLEKAHWFGWVARERLESPDKFPYDKFPHGLDYEESEDFCFKQFLEKHNIKQ